MQVQASANSLDLQYVSLNVSVQLLKNSSDSDMREAISAIETAGGDNVKNESGKKITFDVALNYTGGTLRQVTLSFLKKTLENKFTQVGLTVDGYFVYKITYDYETNEEDILDILRKEGRKYHIYLIDGSITGNSMLVAVGGVKKEDDAELTLGVVLAQTHVYRYGDDRVLDLGTDLRDYKDKKLSKGSSRSRNPEDGIEYAIWAKPKYLDIIKEYLGLGFDGLRVTLWKLNDLYATNKEQQTVKTGDKDVPVESKMQLSKDLQGVDTALKQSLAYLATASWAVYRAYRLDRTVNLYVSMVDRYAKDDPEYYNLIQSLLDKYDELADVSTSIDDVLSKYEYIFTEAEQLRDNNKDAGDLGIFADTVNKIAKFFKESNSKDDGDLLVSETRAVRLGYPVKDVIKDAILAYKTGAEDSAENKVLDNLVAETLETQITDKYTENDFKTAVQQRFGDQSQDIIGDSYVDLASSIGGSEFPAFFLKYQRDLDSAAEKGDIATQLDIAKSYRAKLSVLLSITEDSIDQYGSITAGDADAVKNTLKTEFDGIDPKQAKKNIKGWIKTADKMIKRLEKLKSADPSPLSVPDDDANLHGITPTFKDDSIIRAFLNKVSKGEPFTDEEKDEVFSHVGNVLQDLENEMDEIRPGHRTFETLSRGIANNNRRRKIAELVMNYNTLKEAVQKVWGTNKADDINKLTDKIQRMYDTYSSADNLGSSEWEKSLHNEIKNKERLIKAHWALGDDTVDSLLSLLSDAVDQLYNLVPDVPEHDSDIGETKKQNNPEPKSTKVDYGELNRTNED